MLTEDKEGTDKEAHQPGMKKQLIMPSVHWIFISLDKLDHKLISLILSTTYLLYAEIIRQYLRGFIIAMPLTLTRTKNFPHCFHEHLLSIIVYNA